MHHQLKNQRQELTFFPPFFFWSSSSSSSSSPSSSSCPSHYSNSQRGEDTPIRISIGQGLFVWASSSYSTMGSFALPWNTVFHGMASPRHGENAYTNNPCPIKALWALSPHWTRFAMGYRISMIVRSSLNNPFEKRKEKKKRKKTPFLGEV